MPANEPFLICERPARKSARKTLARDCSDSIITVRIGRHGWYEKPLAMLPFPDYGGIDRRVSSTILRRRGGGSQARILTHKPIESMI